MLTGNALRQIVEANFEVVRERTTEDEVVFLCPESGCGDRTGNRSVNLRNGKTNCWKCNVAGTFVVWARRHGFHFSEGDPSTMSLEDMKHWDRPQGAFLPSVNAVELPPGFTTLVDAGNCAYTRLIGRMARRKNLYLDDFEDAGAGFTRQGFWEPYVIFPVVEDGITVYWQGRTYVDEPGQKTKRFPSRKEVKYGARYWLYNMDELRATQAPVVVVVEAILNVLSLKRFFAENNIKDMVAVAAFKHSISPEQLMKLNQCRFIQEVVMLFDHDAVHRSWLGSNKMANHLPVSVAEMPAGKDNRKLDPNDDVELAWRVIQTRKPYTSLNARRAQYRYLEEKKAAVSLAGLRL